MFGFRGSLGPTVETETETISQQNSKGRCKITKISLFYKIFPKLGENANRYKKAPVSSPYLVNHL